MNIYRLIQGDCCQVLQGLEPDSVDCVVTDPPYGMSFMGKDWDKALPPREAFSEMYRVLKSGALAFVMSSPRQDLLWRMMSLLEDVGFELRQSPIYWAYASGFPKAYDVGKGIDKKLGLNRKEWEIEPFGREGRKSPMAGFDGYSGRAIGKPTITASEPSSEEAVRWDGWKSQTGLKPAVEVILMVNKPFSEKTIVDQVLSTKTGAINVDACRIPFSSDNDLNGAKVGYTYFGSEQTYNLSKEPNRPKTKYIPSKGRFPANLLVSDNVLDTGKITKSKPHPHEHKNLTQVYGGGKGLGQESASGFSEYDDEGGFSRYFSLDAWAKTMPFLITPKASKSERDEGLTSFPNQTRQTMGKFKDNPGRTVQKGTGEPMKNIHPTVKPLKLMSYLVTLGCPKGGTVLDPFVGSGTTMIALYHAGMNCIGIELNPEYCAIADAKMRHFTKQRKLDVEVGYSYEVMG